MSKKLDPRVMRTRKFLREALVELIIEQGFHKLTVKDVTDRATLNHATFYLHYNNLDDLLNQTLQHMLDELASTIPPASDASVQDVNTPIEISYLLFKHFGDNAAFYRVILGADGVASFSVHLRDYLAATLYQRLSTIQSQDSMLVSVQFTAQYLASAYLGIIMWWLDNELPVEPQVLAKDFITLTAVGAYRAIGLSTPKALS